MNCDILFQATSEKEICDPQLEAYLDAYRSYRDDFERNIMPEPILSANSERYTVYPIEHWDIWDLYKKQIEAHWVVDEVSLATDKYDWDNKMSPECRKFLMYVLAFFAAADGIVNANIKQNLIDVVKIKEAECAYGAQFNMENTHGEMYSLMLHTYITDDDIRNKLIRSVKTIEGVRLKAEWCERWIDSDKTYAHKLIAFAIVEGVFFSGSFASIFWIRTLPGSLMDGLRTANKFIAKDEYMHVQLACALYRKLQNRLKTDIVHKIVGEAVEIEEIFINESLPCRLIGMNSESMSQYIKYCADQLLIQLGYPKLYDCPNPFEFMKKIDNYIKQNFFEGRNDVYTDADIDNPREFVILEEGF